MKKLLLITLTLIANFVSAQTQLSDYYDASQDGRGKPSFSYNITVKIQKNTGATAYDTRYTATLVQASPDSRGFYNVNGDGKFYTCNQLGNVCNPNNFNGVTIRLAYMCNGQQKADVVSFRSLNDQQLINMSYGAGGKFCESINFNMNVMGVELNPTHLGQIIDRINQLGTTKTTQNNTNNNNPATQTGTTNTGVPANTSKSYELKNSDIGLPEDNNTNTGVPANTSGNDPLAHFNNPQPTYSNDKTIEAVGQISNALAPMLEEWGNNIQKRREVEQEQQRIYEARNEKITANNEQYYQTFFLNKYLSTAENGDEKSRMILVCEIQSNAFYKDEMLPNLKNWTIKAANNKNFDAMNIIGLKAKLLGKTKPDPFFGFTLKEGLKMLEEAANMGSLDAMTQLGNYYDYKSSTYGGKDAEKAFYWFSKAAENGSPNGMYYLGMIYRYQSLDKSYGVKYKVTKNDSLAFKWFVKSVSNANYIESLFHKSNNSQPKFAGSYFEINSYKELSLMYKNGIGCEQNTAIANKLIEEYDFSLSHKTHIDPWGKK